jgi:hypothetical protein
MYWPRPDVKIPDDLNATIWRYMDFTKFVGMLDTKSLFFSRPDSFEDRFEGTWGRASLVNIEMELRQKAAEGVNVVGGVEKQLKGREFTAAAMRQLTAVNCWHLSEHESAAMWKLYIYSHQGIAIRSSVQSLIDALSDDKQLLVYVGMVNYIDYDADPIPSKNYLNPFLYKRKSFEHERELRVIANKAEIDETSDSFSVKTFQQPFEKPGENVAVDLSTLISSVHLAPGSPRWMERLVVSVASRFGVDVPVTRSKLDDEPT